MASTFSTQPPEKSVGCFTSSAETHFSVIEWAKTHTFTIKTRAFKHPWVSENSFISALFTTTGGTETALRSTPKLVLPVWRLFSGSGSFTYRSLKQRGSQWTPRKNAFKRAQTLLSIHAVELFWHFVCFTALLSLHYRSRPSQVEFNLQAEAGRLSQFRANVKRRSGRSWGRWIHTAALCHSVRVCV